METTRSGLSRRLCEWLDWRSVNGKPREIDASKGSLALEGEGLLELPPAQVEPPQCRGGRQGAPPTDLQVAGKLAGLGEISLVAVSSREPALSSAWNAMLDAHHPLVRGPLCGAQQRYLIRSEHRGWLGALAFSAAAWHLRERDPWIGWSAKSRRANLHKVVANSRFLLLPGVLVPHLASYVLGLAARQVAADWPQRYGYAPVLLESFVDERAYAGTCYRAAIWQRLGETAGRGRQDRYSAGALGRNAIYVLPLTKCWRQQLCAMRARPLRLAPAPREDEDWAEYEFGRVDVHQQPRPPDEPPTLGVAMRMVAQIGSFLGRKGYGEPGATVLWRGLDKLSFITDTFRLFHPALPNGR